MKQEFNAYVCGGTVSPKFWMGQNVWLWASNSVLFELQHKMTRYSKNFGRPMEPHPLGYAYVRGVYITYMQRKYFM